MRLRLRLRNPFRRRGPRFVPTSRRQRLVIAGLAIGTTLAIGVAMLTPHVAYLRAQLALQKADKPRCAPGQTTGCVGGTMGVIVVTPASAPPR